MRQCTFIHCEEEVTHLAVEAHDLACLFKSGAGLVCEKHSKDMALQEQGFVIPLSREKLAGKDCPFCGTKIEEST